MNSSRFVFFTNDVETFSLKNHCLSDKTGEKVLKEGLPILLEIYNKYQVESTFFVTGYIAEKFPEIVKLIYSNGHEIGCHGYSHESDRAFDVLSLKEQISDLKKSKSILEDLSGVEVISFRAPALRVNHFTVRALEETGFVLDSSVASQRADMFFSFGSIKKLKWLTAPRKGYYVKENNLFARGDSSIYEFPLISYVFPYTGTFMRLSPRITAVVRRVAHCENRFFAHFPIFVIHPNEFLEEILDDSLFRKRSKNLLVYLLADKLRHKLKLKNLGLEAVPLFEDQINYFKRRNYKFLSLRNFYSNHVLHGGRN